ncbi:hypothetical protein EON65_09785 [archaeon]|nr:MAG: hypothetical protein EON65_09785 [archaeon]
MLRRPVYVRISPFNLSSAPIPHLDYSVASQLLSQSIAKFYHEQHLSHLPLLQYAYERIHAALTTQPQYCIPRGRVFVQSYDSQISTPKEFMRSFLTGLYSPLAQEVMGESDLNRAIGLCMDLLAHTYPLMTHAHKDCLHSIQLFHLHVHWQSPSLSEFTRDYNGCAVLPSLRDLFQAYMCGGDESDVKHAHRQSSSAKKAMALSDWQEKIYQLFLHSYETQLVSHSPHEGVSSEYFLFQVDARPFLLYTATKQLLQSYSMWRLQHAKGSLENVFERSVRIVKGDHESHVSSAKDKDPFFIDQTLSAIESIGRRVRSSLSGIVYGLASVFTATSEAKVIEKKIKIAVYVDQESTVVAPVLFTGQRGNVKTMVNLGDYICQGLNHIGMHVSTLWTDKDLRDSIDKEQMPVILTLGHSLPWLYYRIQVLSQRYPNVPIYAIHVHNHQAVGHSENISVSKEGDGVLPAHVQLVSTQALQEEIWSLFQLRLAKELEEQVGKGIGN